MVGCRGQNTESFGSLKGVHSREQMSDHCIDDNPPPTWLRWSSSLEPSSVTWHRSDPSL